MPRQQKLYQSFLAAIPFVLSTIPPSAQSFSQTITFLSSSKRTGKIVIALFDRKERFPDGASSLRNATVEVSGGGRTTVRFENLAAGTYAIAAFLDENDNGKMDTNLFGIPKEAYGFSNNARPLMRAASFNEAAFEVGQHSSVQLIRLK